MIEDEIELLQSAGKDISGVECCNGMPKERLPGRNWVSRVDREWAGRARARAQGVAQGYNKGDGKGTYHLKV